MNIDEFDKFYALVSGGKDSITAAHYFHNNVKPLTGVLLIDTTIGLKETHDHVKAICKANNWELTILKPKKTYEEFVLKYGFPRPHSHRWVFIELKWKPIYYWLKEQEGTILLISGVRRKESKRRMLNAKEWQVDQTYKRMVFHAPLIEWSDSKVWAYLKKHNLEVSPSYKTIHISGDCLCGAFSSHGEAELINIFYPEVADRIKDLESRCGNKICTWGRQNNSIGGSASQKQLEGFFCADCHQ